MLEGVAQPLADTLYVLTLILGYDGVEHMPLLAFSLCGLLLSQMCCIVHHISTLQNSPTHIRL